MHKLELQPKGLARLRRRGQQTRTNRRVKICFDSNVLSSGQETSDSGRFEQEAVHVSQRAHESFEMAIFGIAMES